MYLTKMVKMGYPKSRYFTSYLRQLVIICSLTTFGVTASFAQYTERNVSLDKEKESYRNISKNEITPNSEAIQRKEQSGVDMFHGAATVNIPLFTLAGDAMSYDIGLGYYSGGVRLNEIPGLMGLSWSLIGESQISRTVNGSPDELYNMGWKDNGIVFERGYYFFGSQYNNAYWNSDTFMFNHNDPLHSGPNKPLGQYSYDGQPDEFQFNFAGHSGSFFRSETGEWKVKSKENLDIKIEEVIHTMDYNQSDFYRFNNDNWKSLGDTGTNDSRPQVASLFTQFTLTTPDGYKYIFGGPDSAIEFSRTFLRDAGEYVRTHINMQRTANTWKLSKIISPLGEEITFTYNRGKCIFRRDKDYLFGVVQGTGNHSDPTLDFGMTMMNPVYLSSIESSRGKLIFKRSQPVEKWYRPLFAYQSIYNCDLSAILVTNDINFFITRSFRGDGDYIQNDFLGASVYPGTIPNYNAQVDSILYFDKISQQYVDGYKFIQSANPNVRRTLDGFYKFNFRDSKIENKYAFTYNNVAGLPEYDANSKDYWGFYNGDTDTIYCGVTPSTFPNFHSAESLLGMLTKIENPLGGSTEFTYEGNVYKKKAKVDLSLGKVGIEELPGYSNFGPGCRVKQIKHVDIYGSPAVVKNYVYDNSYPASNPIGNSGVLNFDFVEDRIKINKCRDQWGIDSTYAFNNFELYNYSTKSHNEFTKMFKGGVVNYSTVTEVNADNSYTTFKYSNLDDTSYRDEIHCGYTSDNVLNDKNFRISSTDMDRGNMVSVTYYDPNNEKVKEVINTFDYSPSRKNKFIKAHDRKILAHMGVTCDGGLVNLRAWAFKYYYYNTPLLRTEERLYNDAGNYASTQTEFAYDNFGNVVSKSQTTSEGTKITTEVKYNSNPDYNVNTNDAVGLGIRNLMTQYGIKNFPVEQIVKKSAINPSPGVIPQVINAELYTYVLDKPLLLKKYATEFTEPVLVYDNTSAPNGFKSSTTTSNSFSMDSRYKLQENIIQYTTGINNSHPKVLTNIKNKVPFATTYDYYGLLPSSKTNNAAYTEVAYAGFEGDYSIANSVYKNGWDYSGTIFPVTSPAKAIAGSRALTVSPSLTATANNAVIKTNLSLIAGKKYMLSFWATRPSGVEYYVSNGSNVQFLSPVKSLSNGWYYYETELTAISNQPMGVICFGTGGLSYALIDEVMLFPSIAKMESLSYDTRSNQVITQNKGNGQLLNFEYDGLGRQTAIRDEDGNLLKTQDFKQQDN